MGAHGHGRAEQGKGGPKGPGAEGLFPAAGGEVGRLIAAIDWADTPIGPIDCWPQSLRTVVSIFLSSRHPMVIWWGPQLALIYNDAWMPILGPNKHPALGRPGAEVWPENWHIVGPQLRSVLATGEATWSDDQLLPVNRSGYLEEAYFTYSHSAIRDETGRVGGVFSAVTETTARVLGERRMRTLRELGEISSAQAATVEQACTTALEVLARNRADVPFAAIYLLDPDGASARLVASYGAEKGSALLPPVLRHDERERPIWTVIDPAQPQVVTGLRERYPGMSAAGSGPVGDAVPDGMVVLPLVVAGQARPVGVLDAGISPYRALDEDYRAFFALVARHVATAVADARAYADERARAQALTELDRAKTEFFSNVSHEFRTPLTLITGPAEDVLADQSHPLPQQQREQVQLIRRNAARLRRLVNNMLDFARIEGGRMQVETVATDLSELTRAIVASFAAAIERAGLGLVIDCPPLERVVYVDRDMWEKIVLNLLSNALKSTLHGHVRVGLRGGEDDVELIVTDTGVGIPADQLPLLFQRFHRVQGAPARSHEGTGIGLALVGELARLHGGGVSVTSEEGQGSAFTVRLPYGSTATAAVPPQRTSSVELYLEEALHWSPPDDQLSAMPLPAAGATAGATVLVVEDNADLRGFLTRLLTPYWHVVVAGDGQAALERIRQAPPDLVLTDVMMPRLDGFGLLRALRADAATAHIPVIVLSARAGEESAIEGLGAGADDYLVKPFSSQELTARVRSNLELARLRNHEATWRAALVDSLQEGFFVADSRGTVVETNQAFAGILGYGPTDVPCPPPHPWWPDAAVDPAGRAQVDDALTHVLAHGQGRFTLPLCHRDGHRLWAAVAISSVTDTDSGQRMFVGTLRDVTAEHLAGEREAAMARLSTRLARASGASEVLGAGLAESAALWGARRALAASWNEIGQLSLTTEPPGSTWESLDEDLRAALVGIRDSHTLRMRPVDSDAAARVTGVGAPIESDGTVSVLWLDLAEPRTFSTDDRALFALLCSYLGQALQRARAFDEQRTVALTLQRSILGPTALPAGFAVRYEPAVRPLEVGGDWYDVVGLGDDRVGVVVGDCVGRGLAAATVMGQLRSACRALLLQAKSPGQVLAALDDFACLVPDAWCTTVWCAIIDQAEGLLCYANAGHPPALLVHADGTGELLDEARSIPLAIRPGTARPEVGVELSAGSTLLLYTDGLVERRRESIDVGISRALQAVTASRSLPPEQVADHLLKRLLPDQGHDDDVALLVYRHEGPAEFGASLRAEVAELASLRRQLRQWLSRVGVTHDTLGPVLVATGEACANAVEHAYRFAAGHTVRVAASRRGDSLHIRVTDTGTWKPSHASAPGRGNGLRIMRGLMDDVVIDSTEHGTTVRLYKRLIDEC